VADIRFTVALIGPDGAGKTTICRRLAETLPLQVKYFYMGSSGRSSNILLPTTRLLSWLRRLGARLPGRVRGWLDSDSPVPRLVSGLGLSVRLANQLCEEWYRQVWVAYYQRHGYLVVFDRHFAPDHLAYDILASGKERPLVSRVRGFLLRHFYPLPDLVIYLDAPAEVLFARKRQWTPKVLEERRRAYLQIQGVVENYIVVDASRPEEDVARAVSDQVWQFYQGRADADRLRVSGQNCGGKLPTCLS
jgi:thymidylate kinase